jgi:hypothetical protein
MLAALLCVCVCVYIISTNSVPIDIPKKAKYGICCKFKSFRWRVKTRIEFMNFHIDCIPHINIKIECYLQDELTNQLLNRSVFIFWAELTYLFTLGLKVL